MPQLNTILAAGAVAVTVTLGAGAAQATYNHAPHGSYAAPMHWLRAAVHGRIDSLFTGDSQRDLPARVWMSSFSLSFDRACSVFGPSEADAVAAMRDAERNTLSSFVNVSRFGEADARLFLRRHGCEGGLATGMRRSVQRVGRIALEFGQAETSPRSRRGEQAQRDVLIINRSPARIWMVNLSPLNEPTWGPDRLGDGVVIPGESIRLRLPDTRECRYDVRVTYEDRRTEERRGLDLCANPMVSFDGSRASNGQATSPDRNRRFGRPFQQPENRIERGQPRPGQIDPGQVEPGPDENDRDQDRRGQDDGTEQERADRGRQGPDARGQDMPGQDMPGGDTQGQEAQRPAPGPQVPEGRRGRQIIEPPQSLGLQRTIGAVL